MTPKEKAIHLVAMMKPYTYCSMGNNSSEVNDKYATKSARECAIILVDEVIATDMLMDEDTYVETVSYLQFWKDVRKELEKIN